jgi:hypothetical protein
MKEFELYEIRKDYPYFSKLAFVGYFIGTEKDVQKRIRDLNNYCNPKEKCFAYKEIEFDSEEEGNENG